MDERNISDDVLLYQLMKQNERLLMQRDVVMALLSSCDKGFKDITTAERYQFIANNRDRAGWTIELMCDVMEVSRSGYYKWLKNNGDDA